MSMDRSFIVQNYVRVRRRSFYGKTYGVVVPSPVTWHFYQKSDIWSGRTYLSRWRSFKTLKNHTYGSSFR